MGLSIPLVVDGVGGVYPSPRQPAMTADGEFEAAFFCGTIRATPTSSLPSVCPVSQFGSTLISVPAPGAENYDHSPPRIASRYLFDASIGDVDLVHFHSDKYKLSLQLTAINLTNNYALYNFLSTFSGTHYVSPRSFTAELGFH